MNKRNNSVESELNNMLMNNIMCELRKTHIDMCKPDKCEELRSIINTNNVKCSLGVKQHLNTKINIYKEECNQLIMLRKIEKQIQIHTYDSNSNSNSNSTQHCTKCISCNNDKCHITIRQKQCCACKDKRPVGLTGYHKYIDGIGDTYEEHRNANYCPYCKITGTLVPNDNY